MSDVGVKISENMTPSERTRYLSREFLLGFVINLTVLIGGGFYAFGRLEARATAVEPAKVTALEARLSVVEANQVDSDRVTRLETKMDAVLHSMERLQDALDREIREIRNQRDK